MRFFKTILIFLPLVIISWLIIGFAAAKFSTMPRRHAIPFQKQLEGHDIESVLFYTKDSLRLSGWLIEGKKASKDTAVILLSGIYGSRLSMVKRAPLYLERGYTTLLMDMRGQGNSGGEVVSYGWHERHDLLAACTFLQSRGFTHIAVHGQSLGAATIIYSFQEKTDYVFVILESSYDNIENAFSNRVPLLKANGWLVAPMRVWIERWANIQLKDLYPERFIPLYKNGKVLLLAGDSEKKVRPEETQKLYEKCTATEKYLHWFKGARHVDFMKNYEAEMTVVLETFLNKVITSATSPK